MTTLLSEIFSETEVTFVNEANPQNLQMSGDSWWVGGSFFVEGRNMFFSSRQFLFKLLFEK